EVIRPEHAHPLQKLPLAQHRAQNCCNDTAATEIYPPIRGNIGIGFAIPASRVRALLSEVP
ncbi:MAG TPA: hypothetical protein PKE32_06415, partial [Miltoncostaeaceae bacterium]|nr:hypothetical protein [Miltoncostaeaceae bacterium]